MTEDVPATLRPPVPLALAKAVESVPAEAALPGGSVYEPKWDGYRMCALVWASGVSLWSRQGRDLTRYFPDLVEAVAGQVPPGCVLDGEAVVWTANRLDFDALQRRLVASKAGLPALVREHPASFAAFDLLAVAGHDIREAPLSQRRQLLEQLAGDWEPPLNLSPTTKDRAQALTWFEELHHAGLEGLVVKGAAQSYQPVRQWLKFKHRETLEIICGAVIGPITQPSEIVAGLILDGELRIVGRSTPLKTREGRELARWLHPPVGEHPWPATVKGTDLDRFNRDKEPVALTLVEPVVVEVSADTAWSGRSFRHPLRTLRARPELSPADITLPGRLHTD